MGKLVVIEGLDGAGKRTLANGLTEALHAQGRTVTSLAFPRYGQSVHADLVRDALYGTIGDLSDSVYGMAVLYADTRRVMPVIEQTHDLEFRLASAIAGMTVTSRPRVTFLAGFGAKTPDQIEGMRQSFADRYTLRTADVSGDSAPALRRRLTSHGDVKAATPPADAKGPRSGTRSAEDAR